MTEEFDMNHARDLQEKARSFEVYSCPDQTGYGCDHSKHPDWQAMEEIRTTVYPAALNEIERLNAVLADLNRQKALIQTCRVCGEGKQSCPPHQLTIEQREALEYAVDNVDPRPIVYIDAIRDLLSDTVPAWEATDERIAAMKDACNFLVYAEIRNRGVNPGNVDRAKNAGDVLRAMLEEVGQP